MALDWAQLLVFVYLVRHFLQVSSSVWQIRRWKPSSLHDTQLKALHSILPSLGSSVEDNYQDPLHYFLHGCDVDAIRSHSNDIQIATQLELL